MPPPRHPDIQEIPGCGIVLIEASKQVWTLGYLAGDGLTHDLTFLPAAPWSNHPADAVLRHDGTIIAEFRSKDTTRPDTLDTLAALHRQECTLHILSGDRSQKVAHLADMAGLPPTAHWEITGLSKKPTPCVNSATMTCSTLAMAQTTIWPLMKPFPSGPRSCTSESPKTSRTATLSLAA